MCGHPHSIHILHCAASTEDRAVFSFNSGDQPCQGLGAAVSRYRELAPHVKLAGPTSFAPAINQVRLWV